MSKTRTASPGKTKSHVVTANIYQLVDADGVFAGVSLDGYVIGARSRHNRDYYGRAALRARSRPAPTLSRLPPRVTE